MANSREVSIWVDERWARAIEEHLPNHDLQEKMVELLEGLIEQLPEQVREPIRQEIAAEDARWAAEREANRRFSAIRITSRGQESYVISEGGTDLLHLSGSVRQYLSQGADGQFAPRLYKARECGAAEFRSAVAERMEGTGRVVGVFTVDMDAEKLSTLDESGGWHQYRFRDLSAAAYAANRKTMERPQRRQEIFEEKLRGKELTPLTETQSTAPVMEQTM